MPDDFPLPQRKALLYSLTTLSTGVASTCTATINEGIEMAAQAQGADPVGHPNAVAMNLLVPTDQGDLFINSSGVILDMDSVVIITVAPHSGCTGEP